MMSLIMFVCTLLLSTPLHGASISGQSQDGHSLLQLVISEDACGSTQCPSDDKTHVVCATITNKFWADTEQDVSTPVKHNHCICVGATTFYLNKYHVTVEDCQSECPVGPGKK